MQSNRYLAPYRAAAKRCGTDFSVTLWADERSQRLRFDVMTQMCFLTGKRILDAGCGRGDFAAFLLEREIMFDNYVGVDAMANVIDFAAQRGLPHGTFQHGDFLKQPELFSTGNPQVICISGALNTMPGKLARSVLQSAWQATSQMLIFNFLSNRTSEIQPPHSVVRRFNPARMLDWALRRTQHVSLRHDYFDDARDATICMRK